MRMLSKRKQAIAVVIMLSVIAVVAATAIVQTEAEEGWETGREGLLAVPYPCCTDATLWSSIDEVREDGQRPKPATAAEAAAWINTWPYRVGTEDPTSRESAPRSKVRNTEVRCTGIPVDPELAWNGNDTYTLEAIRFKRQCVFTKWRVWAGDQSSNPPNERHTVWAGDDGFFYGRVDHWR
jgi:hypothetical protein